MISRETEERLRRLLEAQPTYVANQSVTDQIHGKSVVGFVGATCMGKTTIMQALIASDPKTFGEFIVFTSRAPRENENQSRYTYYDHTDEGLAELLDRIEKHEVLQYNINPFSLYIYGSEATGYPHPQNLGDIFASSIEGFRQTGFGHFQAISIVTDPELWRQRLDERFPAGHPGRKARLQEAISSLEWSLAQKNSEHAWVINTGSPERGAESVKRTLTGRIDDQAYARHLAQGCLNHAKEALGREP